MTQRRIAVVGAREYPDPRVVSTYIRELAEERDRGADIVIVSGGAEGVDLLAQQDAVKLHLKTVIHLPQDPVCRIEIHDGKTTLHSVRHRIDLEPRDQLIYRNTLIALDCTEMTLFPEGSKGGCWDAAREARRFKRPVWIRHVDGKLYEYTGGFTKKSKGSWRQEGLFDD